MDFQYIQTRKDFQRWQQEQLMYQFFTADHLNSTYEWSADALVKMMTKINLEDQRVIEAWPDWLVCIVDEDDAKALAKILFYQLSQDNLPLLTETIANRTSTNCLRLLLTTCHNQLDHVQLKRVEKHRARSVVDYLETLREFNFDLQNLEMKTIVSNPEIMNYYCDRYPIVDDLIIAALASDQPNIWQCLITHQVNKAKLIEFLPAAFLAKYYTSLIECLDVLLNYQITWAEIFSTITEQAKIRLIWAIGETHKFGYMIMHGLTKQDLMSVKVSKLTMDFNEVSEFKALMSIGVTWSDLLFHVERLDNLFERRHTCLSFDQIEAFRELGLSEQDLSDALIRSQQHCFFDKQMRQFVLSHTSLSKEELLANFQIGHTLKYSDQLDVKQDFVDYIGLTRDDFEKAEGLIFPEELLIKSATKT